MDASRYNSPSRKSRFRAQGSPPHRPAASPEEPPPESGEEAEGVAPEELQEEPAAIDQETAYAAMAEPAAEYHDAGVMPPDAEPTPSEPEDQLPAGLRLTRSTERTTERGRRAVGPLVAMALGCLVLGGAGGYFLRASKSEPSTLPGRPDGGRPGTPILPLNPAVLADVDAAFESNKQGKFTDARQSFSRLAAQHPEWPSLQIEAARAALYEHNFEGAEKTLAALLRAGPNVDAEFLMGLLQMTLQNFDKSEAAFSRAVALDPARPDIFYFWGECLRRQGKPQEAADKFREAIVRNQYETTEGLYQLKLWLSQIQADQEGDKGINPKIDTDLATDHPSGPALFAAAARDIKAGRFKEAGQRIGQAQKVMEPAVFRVVLQDPIFLQESYRPELAPFYK